MADNKKIDSPRSSDLGAPTEYVTEEAPKLPTADVTVTSGLPVIDKRLVEARNREAKAMADRFNK